MRVLPVNSSSVLVELADLNQMLGLLASLQAQPLPAVVEIVPGARTLLIEYDPLQLARADLLRALAARPQSLPPESDRPRVEIPVHYDGEDLPEVARLLGLSPAEVVQRHTGRDWFVAFTGFAPGFGYLSGGDPILTVPRRQTPRTRIPPGAVALAGGFSAIYPKASPGGWQLIGQTFAPMWDLGREPPALLQPGQWVRFVDAGPRPAARQMAPTAAPTVVPTAAPTVALVQQGGEPRREAREQTRVERQASGPALEIRSPGLQALLEDGGRPGQAGQGVAASGAVDRGALRAANRLVGNRPDQAAIEVALGGFELISRGETVVAVTGAEGPLQLSTAAGQRWPLARGQAQALADGDRLLIGEPEAGVRSYLAVRGGFALTPVLGSLSWDSLAEVGPAPLAAGDRLPLAPVQTGALVALPADDEAALPQAGDLVELDITLGPRADWFTAAALEDLVTQRWTVTPQSNRIGLRLTAARPLSRAISDELPSEGTAWGAIQVPASGQPVLFLVDHPLTGGYPVIGCVVPAQLDRLGQLPVGVQLRFRVVPGPEAIDLSTQVPAP